ARRRARPARRMAGRRGPSRRGRAAPRHSAGDLRAVAGPPLARTRGPRGRHRDRRGDPGMTCAACGAENREGARFCVKCGATLALACPGCGAPYEHRAVFWPSCGNRLDAPEPPSTGVADAAVTERRLVSVLFADLVGFTARSEDQDPEEVRELLSRYFDSARRVIERYGGTVEKFIGDAVMAVWGSPVAREDDAERAVRAGLELVEIVAGLGKGLAMRLRVVTAEAAVP